MANIILTAVLLGTAYALTGRLAISVGVHFAWNLFQGNVFGFPVSGTTFPAESVAFFSIIQRGPEVWTGGSFGPEDGLISLFAIIAGILLIIGWVRFRQGTIKPDSQLAQPPGKGIRSIRDLEFARLWK